MKFIFPVIYILHYLSKKFQQICMHLIWLQKWLLNKQLIVLDNLLDKHVSAKVSNKLLVSCFIFRHVIQQLFALHLKSNDCDVIADPIGSGSKLNW